MRKILGAFAVAAALALALFAGGGAVTGAAPAGMTTKGGDAQSFTGITQQLRPTKLGDIQLVTVQTVCRSILYPDGANWATPCNQRDWSGGSTWASLTRKLWNVPVSQGGHSDLINYGLWHAGTATEDTGQVVDDETDLKTTDRTGISTSNTVWIRFQNDPTVGYSPGRCREVFFAANGDSSDQICFG